MDKLFFKVKKSKDIVIFFLSILIQIQFKIILFLSFYIKKKKMILYKQFKFNMLLFILFIIFVILN